MKRNKIIVDEEKAMEVKERNGESGKLECVVKRNKEN